MTEDQTIPGRMRVFPAIDILRSGTRKEELLVDPVKLKNTYVLRRILNPMGTVDAIERNSSPLWYKTV